MNPSIHSFEFVAGGMAPTTLLLSTGPTVVFSTSEAVLARRSRRTEVLYEAKRGQFIAGVAARDGDLLVELQSKDDERRVVRVQLPSGRASRYVGAPVDAIPVLGGWIAKPEATDFHWARWPESGAEPDTIREDLEDYCVGLPAGGHGTVLLGGRSTVCINERLQTVWNNPLETLSDPRFSLVEGGRFYGPTREGPVCIDMGTGRMLWTRKRTSVHQTCAANGSVLITGDRVTEILDLESGKTVRTFENGPTQPWPSHMGAPPFAWIHGGNLVIASRAIPSARVYRLSDGRYVDIDLGDQVPNGFSRAYDGELALQTTALCTAPLKSIISGCVFFPCSDGALPDAASIVADAPSCAVERLGDAKSGTAYGIRFVQPDDLRIPRVAAVQAMRTWFSRGRSPADVAPMRDAKFRGRLIVSVPSGMEKALRARLKSALSHAEQWAKELGVRGGDGRSAISFEIVTE